MVKKNRPMDRYFEGSTEGDAEPTTADLLPVQEFVKKLGGLERAKRAVETLAELRDAA